jgi:NitT/TauT family transport system permease protein
LDPHELGPGPEGSEETLEASGFKKPGSFAAISSGQGRRLGSLLPPLVVLVVLLAAWEGIVRIMSVPDYLLPAPSKIIASFEGELASLWPHFRKTLLVTTLGYLIGNGFAFLMAAFMAEFRILELSLFPYLLGLRALPIVAVAPLLIVWFGFTIWPIVATSALICFFPSLVNGVQGFQSTSSTTLELMRGLNASRWEVFRYVKAQNAMPYIFASLKISVASALIGAVVGEWIGSSEGLGYLTIVASNYVDTLLLFRAIIGMAIIAIGGFLIVRMVENRVLAWTRVGGQ